jgi:carotenoid cleavage dioxygenase-like enzyme
VNISSSFWHALNAYGDGGEIIADFVGYDTPDHFAPHNALFYRVMQGEMGEAKTPGTLRRYCIDLAARSLREEILDSGSHEFPMIDPRSAMQKHQHRRQACGLFEGRRFSISAPKSWRGSRCSPPSPAPRVTKAG